MGVRQHDIGQPADLRDRLTLDPQRHEEAGQLDGGRLAPHDLVHGPLGLLQSEIRATHEDRQEVGPGDPTRLNVHRGQAERAPRASDATASATWMGSSGCGTTASASDHAASHPSCGRPVRTSTGGQL